MRLKYNKEDGQQFKCCLCCHVRVGTILLGLWNLIGHLLVIAFLIMSTIHPEVLRNGIEPGASMETDGIMVISENNAGNDMGKNVLEVEYESPNSTLYNRKLRKDDMCLLFALVLCTLLVTLMLLYGTARSRPSYLMPFFFVQVFDFCISCLTVVGYLSYKPNIKMWIIQQDWSNCPLGDRLMRMDEDWLMLLVVISLILLLSVKAYLIGMVWSCYKYLQLRNANRSVVREYTVDPDSEMLLPPKYEDALQMSKSEPPPPPYTE